MLVVKLGLNHWMTDNVTAVQTTPPPNSFGAGQREKLASYWFTCYFRNNASAIIDYGREKMLAHDKLEVQRSNLNYLASFVIYL